MDDLIEEGFPIPTDIVVHEDCFVYCFDMTTGYLKKKLTLSITASQERWTIQYNLRGV